MCGGFSYWAWWGKARLSLGLEAGVLGTVPPPTPHGPWPHRALVQVDLTVSEVGHLLEGIYGDEHGADVGLTDG